MGFSSLSPTRDKALLDIYGKKKDKKGRKEGNKKADDWGWLIVNRGWPWDGTTSSVFENIFVSSFLRNPITHAETDARELSITASGSNYQHFRPTEHLRNVRIYSQQEKSANRNTSWTGSQTGWQKKNGRDHTQLSHTAQEPPRKDSCFVFPTYQQAGSASLGERTAPAI